MVALAIDKDRFLQKCKQVYEDNKPFLESKHDGKVVALYEGGITAIGETSDLAYKEAARKHPDKTFYIRRIGKYSASEYVF